MPQVNLGPGDPLVLSLAADARISNTDYVNDHIWSLEIGHGEPAALSVDTTFGLRARIMRIFPVFKINDRIIIDPEEYDAGVKVTKNYPNYITLSFKPIKDLDVIIDYWVPDSHQIACRTNITNNSLEEKSIQIEWAALLTPSSEGERMTPLEIGATRVLAGITEDLKPILLMTGGPEGSSGPYPCLSKNLSLNPGSSQYISCFFSALSTYDESLEKARETAAINWNGISASLDMINANDLDITTGDSDWDSAILQAQKVAFSLIMDHTEALPNTSFISTRATDQGYSKRGDGSDYDHLWNGQTPLETYFLIDYLLPAHVDLAKGLLNNFLSTQTSQGFIDWKPGLNGYRSQLLSTPILASIALKIYRSCEDKRFLEDIYPKLLSFINIWFDEEHDIDKDGIPEWDHVLQTGFEDNPLFTYWYDWSFGISISAIEGPDICAFLYRECNSMIEISRIISQNHEVNSLEKKAENLRQAVENSWSDTKRSYQYWDRDSHICTASKIVGERKGPGDIIINETYEEPLRLQILITAQEDIPYDFQLFIHGTTQSGTHRIERISIDRIQWHLHNGYSTSERVYKSLEHIYIQGASDNDVVKIKSVEYGFQNQSLLLPLWAGITSPKRAKLLIKKTLTDKNLYWQSYGVRTCQNPSLLQEESNVCEGINLIWNSLIVEGLINYGYRSLAAELIIRNMKAIIQSLKSEHTFRRHYFADRGTGFGEKNIVNSLIPLGAFLSALGIHIISQEKVIFEAFNPFPWSVTIKYRGLTVIRQRKNSMIIFPDGKNTTIRNGKKQSVTLE